MTKEQYELCKIILRKKKLSAVIDAAKLQDENDILNVIGVGKVDFENIDDEDACIVVLNESTVEEYEKRRADAIKFAVGIGIALGSLITGIVAIV